MPCGAGMLAICCIILSCRIAFICEPASCCWGIPCSAFGAPGGAKALATIPMPCSNSAAERCLCILVDGLIVTAHHVVERDDNIKLGLADGSSVNATLVGRDPNTDIAVLRAEAQGLTAATWVDANDLRVGHLMLALGRPGKTVQATLGIVSALGGSWRTPASR